MGGHQKQFIQSECISYIAGPEYLGFRDSISIFAEKMARYLIFSTSVDLVRVAAERVVYVSSDGNYSTLVQADGESRLLSFQLGQVEEVIGRQLGMAGNCFIRIGRNLIVNRSYIYYINVNRQKLILSDMNSFSHTVSASKEALRQLKDLIEKESL